MMKNNVYLLGIISSSIAIVMTSTFLFALILGFWFVEISNIISYITCFILAPAFVIMTISLHYTNPSEKKIWSLIGVAFSIIYAIFILLTYYTQLALAFNPPNVSIDILKLLDYQEPNSWMFVVDMLGYGFLTLSTLFTGFMFSGDKKYKWLKGIYIAHGLFFIPTLVFPLIPLGASSSENSFFGTLALLVWCLIFIPLLALTIKFFRNKIKLE